MVTEDSTLLQLTLQTAVPLWINELQDKRWDHIQNSRIPYIVDQIASHGDNILYCGKTKGDTAKAFNALAEGIAILSFCPGGVKVFGGHWEAKHPEWKSDPRVEVISRALSALSRRDPRLYERTLKRNQ